MTQLRRDTIPDEELSIEDTGWDDRLDGIRLSDNPYAINNWKHYDWEKGWKLADEAVQGEAASDVENNG
ncbi:MAG: hypothetical protein V7677_18625 [Motiliproteus sp.]